MRPRLTESEIKFLLSCLKEIEESYVTVIDFKGKEDIGLKRRLIVIRGMIRKFESFLQGKRHRLKLEAKILCSALTSSGSK